MHSHLLLNCSNRMTSIIVTGCLALVGCEQGRTTAPANRGTERSTASARLRPGIDSVALERLLASLPESARALARSAYQMDADLYVSLSVAGDSGLAARVAAVTAPGQSAQVRLARAAANIWSEPVTLALVPDGAAGLTISRSMVRAEGDRILIPMGLANVEHLSAALRMLARLRQREATTSRNISLVFRATERSLPSELPSSWRSYLEGKLNELRAARMERLPGLGDARVVRIARMGS